MISELIEDYEKLSDFEINKEITLSLGLPLESDEAIQYEKIGDSLGYYDKDRVISILSKDYCSEPDLAYPLIFDNKISVYWNGGPDDTWKARTIHTPFVEHENPLRAALTIFLIMKKLEEDNMKSDARKVLELSNEKGKLMMPKGIVAKFKTIYSNGEPFTNSIIFEDGTELSVQFNGSLSCTDEAEYEESKISEPVLKEF